MKQPKRRVAVGDVFSMSVDRGAAYIQTIGEHPRYKRQWIVRVLDQIDPLPSNDAAAIASGSEKYTVFVGDVRAEEREGRLRYVGRAEVPEQYKDWRPLIRGNSVHPSQPIREVNWWLDDGVKEWKIGRLPEAYQSLTNGTFIPILSLKRKINRGWDPNWEFKGEGAAEYLYPETEAAEDAHRSAHFFLLFADKSSTEAATAALAAWDLSFDLKAFDADEEELDETDLPYMLVVTTNRVFASIDELNSFESRLEKLASSFNGTYDGNEIPLQLKR